MRTVKYDGILYELHIEDFTANVIKDYDHLYKGDIVIPQYIIDDDLQYQVVAIDKGAFYGCVHLNSIQLPLGLITIDDMAFYQCSSLQAVIIPDTVLKIGGWSFYHCTSLEAIQIPSKVRCIPDGTFCDCRSLKTVILPNSIASFGHWAFGHCYELASIRFPKKLLEIGDTCFAYTQLGKKRIPDRVRYVGEDVFLGCKPKSIKQ